MTQTRKEALTELLAKAEAGVCPSIDLCVGAFGDWSSLALASFDDSLDAAKALHEAVLPGWHRVIWGHSSFAVNICDPADRISVFGGTHETEARAWLIAILKTLIAQEPDQ